jgi:hypothetical protein
MKVRNGFVSNSSSSSFIVIGDGKPSQQQCYPEIEGRPGEFIVGLYGETSFGWDHREYSTSWDRVNFAWIQAQYCADKTRGINRPERMEMLTRVIKEYTGAKEVSSVIDLAFDGPEGPYNVWGYIDHQSSADESMNLEMFENDETLARFLFSPDSYIQGDNDNR